MKIELERPEHWYYFGYGAFLKLSVIVNGNEIAKVGRGEKITLDLPDEGGNLVLLDGIVNNFVLSEEIEINKEDTNKRIICEPFFWTIFDIFNAHALIPKKMFVLKKVKI